MGVVKEKKLVERKPIERWVAVTFRCDGCGRVDDDPWPPFVDLTVEIAKGEEGHQGHRESLL